MSRDAERPSPPESAEEAVITKLTQATVAAWRGVVSPVALELMRDILGDILATHPVATRLVGELKTPPVVAETGPVATDAAEADAQDLKKAKGGGDA